MKDGKCDAVLYQADDGKKRPGVIHYPDIMGIRPSHRAMAKRLSEAGYTVVLVNPFYRTVKGPCFDFTPNFGGDPRTLQRFGELAGPCTPEAMESDASAFVDYLAAQSSVSGAKMGAVGYCFTGQVSLRTAAARPEKIGAIASFHGGGLLRISRQPASGFVAHSEVEWAEPLFWACGERSLDAERGDREV